MPYNCVVLAKQVPDTTNITGKAMKAGWHDQPGCAARHLQPGRPECLEMALQVREQHGGR